VIGDPIEHTLSPIMHNAAFEALKLDFTYVAFRVKRGDVENAIRGVRALGIHGLSVTMPHKIAVMKYLDRVDDFAHVIGSVNTVLNKDGQLFGYNTDGVGALNALRENEVEPKGKKVVLLGAGGAAKAVAYALAQVADELVILNRTAQSAVELANSLGKVLRKTVVSGELSSAALEAHLSDADVLVNATSVGMKPNIDQIPVPSSLLKSDLALLDIIYDPVETNLAKEAKCVGAKVVSGVEMLIYQGAASFEIWTGLKAPVEVMRKAALKELQRS